MTPASVGSNPTVAVIKNKKGDCMREKVGYREALELLCNAFNDKKLLRPKEVADYFGINVKTAKKRFSFKDGYISIVVLAREMC